MNRLLGDISSTIDYGVTASAVNSPVGPKFLRITDIQDGAVDWDTVPWCACSEREAASSQLQDGDIVFARTGATTGKSFLIRQAPSKSVFASYLIRVRLGKEADPLYVSHFFNSPSYWRQITGRARGVAQPGVNSTSLKTLEIPLPPLAEQKRIAGILDAADALRAKRREALAQLDTLLQATFLDLFGDPVTNPKFPCGPIRPFASANSGKSAKNVVSHEETEIPIYGGNGVNGWATKALYEQCVLVFGRVGQQCGNTFLTTGPAWVTDNAIVLTVNDKARLSDEYLLHAFRMTKFAERVKHLDLPFINQGIILDYPLCLPPLSLQLTFTRCVRAIDQMRITHRAHLAELDALFAALQSRAFRGEL